MVEYKGERYAEGRVKNPRDVACKFCHFRVEHEGGIITSCGIPMYERIPCSTPTPSASTEGWQKTHARFMSRFLVKL